MMSSRHDAAIGNMTSATEVDRTGSAQDWACQQQFMDWGRGLWNPPLPQETLDYWWILSFY